MPENQDQPTTEISNYFKNTKEWFEIIKWIIIFVISVFLPLTFLVALWLLFNPDAKVFSLITIVYFTLTLILIKPLVDIKDK